MNYLEAWREGHEAGMSLTLKIINEITGHDFETASEVILYIKQLEGDEDFKIAIREHKEEQQIKQPDNDELSTKEKKFIEHMAQRMAINNWLWSD